jgi:hypothetical protein
VLAKLKTGTNGEKGTAAVTIRDGVDVFYYTQSVASADQAVSLAQYLIRHGQSAYKADTDEVQVVMECASQEQAAAKSATVYTLVQCWRLFWEHSDAGVFELPIYVKD